MTTIENSRLPAGRRIGAVMGWVIPTVTDIVERWANIYPVLKGRPDNPMMVCTCGCFCAEIDLEHVRTLRGRHNGHPGQDSPDEHVTLCRVCLGRDTYRQATPDEIESEFAAEKADLHEGRA